MAIKSLWHKLIRFACTAVLLLGLAAQAAIAQQDQQAETNKDPWEGFNRAVFGFNDTLDRYFLKPIAQGYVAITPKPVVSGVDNFFSNIGDVTVVANDILQLNLSQAAKNIARIFLNTIFGLGGFVDVATRAGLPKTTNDFGITLARWGVNSGPYLVLPILGPSSLRGALGTGAGFYTDPVTYTDPDSLRYSLTGVRIVSGRAKLLPLERAITGGDRYVLMRDVYLQRRNFLIQSDSTDNTENDPFAGSDDGF
jgi:phospholipid-binding lipoprotein MlaA